MEGHDTHPIDIEHTLNEDYGADVGRWRAGRPPPSAAILNIGYRCGMKRSDLLDHLRRTHFESGDRRLALANAKRIAQFLRAGGGASRVVGIGSAFDRGRPFTHRSDIDIVASGIEPRRFYAVSAEAAALTRFRLDLSALETATPALRRVVDEQGGEL